MNESLVKYLAGLLDADGCLSFNFSRGYDERVRLSLRLSLVAADEIDRHGFVASLPLLTGIGKTTRTYDKYTCWYTCQRADLEMLLPRLIKHMVIKAQHWQWMLDYWRRFRSQDQGQKSLSEDDVTALKNEYRESRKNRVGPIKPKNHPTWAWLAGYLDGDGCFSFRTSKNKNMRLSVTAHVCDMAVLEFLQKAFGGTIKNNSRSENIKVWWRGLGPSHNSFALRFLPSLVHHSRFKKHRIEQMIQFHRQRLSVSAPAGGAIV
jgi:hypothetical protein